MYLTPKQVLEGMPTWWVPLTNWSVSFRVRGPKWIPVAVRRLPLLICCQFANVKVRHFLGDKGEGPRSGGGGATSGAGAQRKEGVQPPDDSTSAMEVSA